MRAKPAAPFLRFLPLTTNGVTHLYDVQIARTSESIGTILWRSEWRQYAFQPRPGGSYTRSTLRLILRKIGRLMLAWGSGRDEIRKGLPPPPRPIRNYARPGRPTLETQLPKGTGS